MQRFRWMGLYVVLVVLALAFAVGAVTTLRAAAHAQEDGEVREFALGAHGIGPGSAL